MSLTCASRFSVLKLEDDEELEKISAPVNKNKGKSSKNGLGTTDVKSKPKKKKKQNDAAQLQNLAFGSGIPKSKKSISQNSKSTCNTNLNQWEEWKKKDSEFVTDVYEHDLQKAILLSKIDYEEKKDVYSALQKETEKSKSGGSTQKKKKTNTKKEKGIMSLDKFQSLSSSQIDSRIYTSEVNALDDFSLNAKPIVNEPDFFHAVEADAERIIEKEQRQEMYKNFNSELHNINSLRFQDEIEKKDEQIKLITEERNKLKEDLKLVKTRNKKLCSILGTGEMKEKADLVIELNDLSSVRDELTEQLNVYIAALEQEKSKVHSLQAELKKFHGNRKEHKDSK